MIKYFFISVFVLITISVNAQKVNFNRSIGTRGIGLSVMFLNKAYGLEAFYKKKIAYQFNYMIAVNYFQGKAEYSNFESYNIENKYDYEFINLSGKLIVSAGAKINLGVENIVSTIENQNKNFFTIGGGVLIITDFYITRRFALHVEGSINTNFKSEIYKNYYRINTGFKFLML